jgi:hypothetical protein
MMIERGVAMTVEMDVRREKGVVRSEIEARLEVLVWEAEMWRTLRGDAGKAKKAGLRLVKSVSVRKRTLCISSNTPSFPQGQVQCQRCENELKVLVVESKPTSRLNATGQRVWSSLFDSSQKKQLLLPANAKHDGRDIFHRQSDPEQVSEMLEP